MGRIFELETGLHRTRTRVFIKDCSERDRVSIDVGANIGVYTQALAKLTPRVYAFEPSKEMASLLRRVTPSNVIVCESAASDRAGNAMLKIPVARGQKIFGLASLEPVADFVETESQNVELTRLDDAIQDDVGFIKIDVEGHE